MIVNMLGHPVAVVSASGHLTLLTPSGPQVKLCPREISAHKEIEGLRIAMATTAYVEGLPPAREGVVFLVPPEVAMLTGHERWDLCSIDPSSLVAERIGPWGGAPCYSRLLAWDTSTPVALSSEKEVADAV